MWSAKNPGRRTPGQWLNQVKKTIEVLRESYLRKSFQDWWRNSWDVHEYKKKYSRQLRAVNIDLINVLFSYRDRVQRPKPRTSEEHETKQPKVKPRWVSNKTIWAENATGRKSPPKLMPATVQKDPAKKKSWIQSKRRLIAQTTPSVLLKYT